MAEIVVVFDFDRTIIDGDSDRWVIDELGATELFQRLLPTMPWNSLMVLIQPITNNQIGIFFPRLPLIQSIQDRMMTELHSQRRTVDEIAKCLIRVPLDPHIAAAIKSAHSTGCDLRVVSDANLFFIQSILNHHGLMDYFSEISTNPVEVDEDGRLRVFQYHEFNTFPHGCSICPPNMCKGKIMDRIRASTDMEKRFIYVGDGRGDYCPCLRLDKRDCVMPRKNYPLWDLIGKNVSLLKAEVREWSNGEELERVLMQLISTVANTNMGQSLSVECKYQTIPISSHEAPTKSIHVPH